MPFPPDNYIHLLDTFAEIKFMSVSYLNDPLVQNPNPPDSTNDFFVSATHACAINDFTEKPHLTQAEIDPYLRTANVDTLLVPLLLDDANDLWAIVVYELNPPTLTYYNLNGNFLPPQIATAFCDVMSCSDDTFFNDPLHYSGCNIMFIDQMTDAGTLIWGTLNALMLKSLSVDAPYIDSLGANAEMQQHITESELMSTPAQDIDFAVPRVSEYGLPTPPTTSDDLPMGSP